MNVRASSRGRRPRRREAAALRQLQLQPPTVARLAGGMPQLLDEHPATELGERLLQVAPHHASRAAPAILCSVRGGMVVLLTTAPVTLMTLRAVPSVAVAGPAGMAAEFGWDHTSTGIFLSAFFYGYISSQMLGGWAASPTRLGGKRVLALCVMAACLASAATPYFAAAALGPVLAARVVEGLAQGPLFPAAWGVLGVWLPPAEISAGASVANSGFGLGSMLAFFAAPAVMGAVGWRGLYYAPAVLGALWLAVWLSFAAESPALHPRISAAERALIANAGRAPPPSAAAKAAVAVPPLLGEMLRAPAL
eukprot:SAG11_NODE_3417_length_2461_cov_3.698561_1_plen_307_part_10